MDPKKLRVSEVKEFLAQLSLFSNLKEDAIHAMAQAGMFITIKKGQFIFLQTDPADKFFILVTGAVSILLDCADGREMVINEMQPGDFFGELGILTGKTRSTSAVAHKNSELLAIPHQAFLSILESEPLFARRILDTVAQRLRNSSQRESALAFMDAQARLARILLLLNELAVEKGYVTISQDELAHRTGMTRQTVAKTLGKWRRAGWVITGRGHIMLLRHDELAKIELEWPMT
jgi:CRP/FNR family transcriptional regulator, cyclic AMP receptor protein